MSTPSELYPYSPTPDAPSTSERRRSKRESTASQTRRFDEADSYPSPPSTAVSDAGSRSASGSSSKRRSQTYYDPSLVIPPYNAATRRSKSSTASVTHTHAAPTLSASVGNPRPVSAAVIPVPHSTAVGPSTTRSARQSVSYFPTATTQASAQNPMAFPYTPHPLPKQRVMFGPYILLQTLGEGEFGKVKLGLHAQRWGEEVAIKLIKRGNVDTVQRTAKVRREIDVLKAVRHPNIVRLYDVIETEKYIGIVLEYASGGELFDHILAHRYLKDRDASKLFAQLISAVMYLHAKGVVHRDLKLENLLLDRNRNVIVTDFGFANRFFDARRDLMSTSCGSPCYAAPELVISDGKYVGTAVDVWSCGVILYAMLAGYLPYDDDPANPEGDNINLLYKYITTTELTFPDWISQEARELLLLMLVSDPEKRCTIHEVARHSWLRKYYGMLSLSVEQLEYEAQQAEIAKRQALEAQRQYLLQQQALAQAAASGSPPPMTRSQSSTMTAANRHRSAIVTSSTMQQGLASMAEETPSAPPVSRAPVVQPYQPSTSRRSTYNTAPSPTTQAHPVTVDADAFSFDRHAQSAAVAPPMVQSLSAPPVAQTVFEDQVMSDAAAAAPEPVAIPGVNTTDDAFAGARQPRSRPGSTSTTPSTQSRRSSARDLLLEQHMTDSERRKKASTRSSILPSASTPISMSPSTAPVLTDLTPSKSHPISPLAPAEMQDVDMISADAASSLVSKSSIDAMSTDSTSSRAEEKSSTDDGSISQAMQALPAPLPTEKALPRPDTPPLEPAVQASSPSTPVAAAATSRTGSSGSSATPKKRKNGSPASAGNGKALAESGAAKDELPPLPTTAAAETTPRASKKTHASSSSDTASIQAPSVASSGSRNRHQRTTSALPADRFSLKSLLGSSTSSGKADAATASADKTLAEVTNERRKTRRQKALSLQPFKSSSGSASSTPTATPTNKTTFKSDLDTIQQGTSTASKGITSGDKARKRQTLAVSSVATTTQQQQQQLSLGQSQSRWSGLTRSSTSQKLDREASESSTASSTAQSQGTGRTNKVIDWFKRRSVRMPASESTTSLSQSQSQQAGNSSKRLSVRPPMRQAASSSVSSRASQAPSVTVTGTGGDSEMTSIPSSRSVSGGAQSSISHFSEISTAATTATTVSTAAPVTPTKARMPVASTTNATPSIMTATPVADTSARTVTPVFAENKLRIHQGATNKNMVTTRAPPTVIVELKNALWSMGIDFVAEGEYRLKCTRKSRKKANTLGQSVSSTASSTGGLVPSPSLSTGLAGSPSMSFKTFFSRRNSLLASPALTMASTPDLSASPLTSRNEFGTVPQPMPMYGDAQTDVADEVKFNVELTRVRDLQGVYCVDVRRLKGELKSFKFVYQNLLANVTLAA